MSEYKTSLVTVNLLNNGEHISNIKNVENVRTTCPFRLKEGWGQKSLSQVSVSGMTTTSIDQARIQGGGGKRALAPPYKILDPPMLTHAWQRRLMEEIRRLKSGGCSARRGMTMTALKFDKRCFSTL